jgi:hypothetical protein
LVLVGSSEFCGVQPRTVIEVCAPELPPFGEPVVVPPLDDDWLQAAIETSVTAATTVAPIARARCVLGDEEVLTGFIDAP